MLYVYIQYVQCININVYIYYIYIYVYIYSHIYMYTYGHMYVFIIDMFIRTCILVHIYVHIPTYVCTYSYLCRYTYIHIYAYIHIYSYIYIYIFTFAENGVSKSRIHVDYIYISRLYLHMHMCINIYLSVSIYRYMYVYIYMCIYIFIPAHFFCREWGIETKDQRGLNPSKSQPATSSLSRYASLMSHVWVGHVTHVSTCEWVMSENPSCPHIWICYVTHTKEIASRDKLIKQVRFTHVTRVNGSCHTCEHMWMSHVRDTWMHHVHTCESFMSHMQMKTLPAISSSNRYPSVMSHMWVSHVTRMSQSCHTHKWVVSTRMSESCHTHESNRCPQ